MFKLLLAFCVLLFNNHVVYAQNIELDALAIYSKEVDHSLGALLFIIQFSHQYSGFVFAMLGIFLLLRYLGILENSKKINLIAPIIMLLTGIFWGVFNILHHGAKLSEIFYTIQWTLTYMSLGMFTVMYFFYFIGGVSEVLVVRGSKNNALAAVWPVLIVISGVFFLTHIDETTIFITNHLLIGFSLIAAGLAKLWMLKEKLEKTKLKFVWSGGLLVAGVLCFLYASLHAKYVAL